jgi:hypothetical protein
LFSATFRGRSQRSLRLKALFLIRENPWPFFPVNLCALCG